MALEAIGLTGEVSPTPAGKALLDAFDAIRIINLSFRTDRRQEITSELERLGLVIDGIKIKVHNASSFESADCFPSKGAHEGAFTAIWRFLKKRLQASIATS